MVDAPAPYPLPADLPRRDSDLARLAARVLEHRDFAALTRLPDMLADLGRTADADDVRDTVAHAFVQWDMHTDWSDLHAAISGTWDHIHRNIAGALWWDVFDWAGSLAVLGRVFGDPGSKQPFAVGPPPYGDRPFTKPPPPPAAPAGYQPF